MIRRHPLRNITHPLIDAIYLKKEFCREGEKDVLVIEISRGRETITRSNDGVLMSFLADIDLISSADFSA